MQHGIPHSGSFVAQASPDIRAQFIQKVYTLFFASILTTVAVGTVAAQSAFAPAMASLSAVWMLGTFGCLIAMFFARRASGINVALLFLFAAFEGAWLGPVLSVYNQVFPGVPAQAAWLAGGVFGGLSLYAFQSRRDFSFLGGMLWASLTALLIGGFLMFFLGTALLYTLYCVAGVIIFSGYVLYDTSNLLNTLEPGDEVVGAINLYLDLINLFLFILRLLSIFSGNSSSRD